MRRRWCRSLTFSAGFQEVAESVLQAEVSLAPASLQIQDPVSELLAT